MKSVIQIATFSITIALGLLFTNCSEFKSAMSESVGRRIGAVYVTAPGTPGDGVATFDINGEADCSVIIDDSFCDFKVSYDTEDAINVSLTADGVLRAAGPSYSDLDCPWVKPPMGVTFKLYADGELLATRHYTGTEAPYSGEITAKADCSVISASGFCNQKISWTTTRVPDAKITATDYLGATTPFATGPSGTKDARVEAAAVDFTLTGRGQTLKVLRVYSVRPAVETCSYHPYADNPTKRLGGPGENIAFWSYKSGSVAAPNHCEQTFTSFYCSNGVAIDYKTQTPLVELAQYEKCTDPSGFAKYDLYVDYIPTNIVAKTFAEADLACKSISPDAFVPSGLHIGPDIRTACRGEPVVDSATGRHKCPAGMTLQEYLNAWNYNGMAAPLISNDLYWLDHFQNSGAPGATNTFYRSFMNYVSTGDQAYKNDANGNANAGWGAKVICAKYRPNTY